MQLFIGLGLMYGAMFIAGPTIVAPALNPDVPAAAPPLLPLLFVTIGCGAVSGFHGLVGSGTTSKQLDLETDARFVGYLGSAGEGALALAAIIVATAGFATLEEWQNVYTEFGGGGLAAFVRPLFGTTNQLLAGLTLLVISVILVRAGRPARYTLIPMAFVTTVALLAALYQLWDLYRTSQYLLLFLDVVIVISAVFVMLEAISAFTRAGTRRGT